MEPSQNQSTIAKIMLVGFQDLHGYRVTVFFTLLLIYLASITGNVLIILLVATTQRLLHSPMYFFLSQLSIADITLSTSVCLTLLPAVWNKIIHLTISECITQFFIFVIATTVECFILTVMSYDRYLAICRPLHYGSIMNISLCFWLTIGGWILGFILSGIVSLMINDLSFCGPDTIQHFFCDFDPLVQLSCSDTNRVEMTTTIIGVPETATELMFIIITYIYIFKAILSIQSSIGRQKAFSTCSSHLAVVCTYYGTLIGVYLMPSRGNLLKIKKSLSLLYTVITALLNPLIYSLKNQEIHLVVKKIFQ